MRKLLAVALVALSIIGCGGGGGGQARTIERTTTSARDATTTTAGEAAADLDPQDVVVRLEDLPTGWTSTESDNSEEDCAGNGPTDDPTAVAKAESAFQQSDFGPFVGSGAATYEDADASQEAVDTFANALAECDGYTSTEDDGTTTVYSVTPLSFPKVGDDTYAVRVSGTTAFGAVNLDVVVARRGAAAVYVTNGGLGSADTTLTEKLVRVMVGRIEGA